MLIAFLSMVMAFILGLVVFREREDSSDWAGVVGFTLMAGCLITLIGHAVTYCFSVKTEYVRTESEIVASKPDSRVGGEIHGGVFYTRGRIEETDWYFVLTKHGPVYKQMKVPADNTVIVETEGTPKVVTNLRYRSCLDWPSWIRFHENPKYTGESDTIYVPVGTVDGVKFDIF